MSLPMEAKRRPAPRQVATSMTATSLEPAVLDGGDGDVAGRLRRRDQGEEYRERLAQDTRDDGEGIADDRRPAHQQRPPPVAAVPALRARDRLALHWKPGTVLEPRDEAPQKPVYA